MNETHGDAAAVAPDGLRSSAAWSRIEREFLATGDAAAAQAGLTQLNDVAVADAYGATIGSLFPHASAALAVGEYGRGELAPGSGAEILILFEAESDPAGLKEAVTELARRLWDAGVRPLHAVRTIAECVDGSEQNLELLTSLLDHRLLAGDGAVYAKLESKLPGGLAKHSPKLTQRLCRLARARHASFRDTYRQAWPDILDSPGGLRDLRLANRLHRLNPEHNLNRAGSLDEARKLLWQVRSFLHYRSSGDRNTLDPEAQESIAGQAFANPGSRELWMREYYRHTRAVFEQARHALDACEKSESSLLDNFRGYRARFSNTEFTVSRERLLLRNPAQLESDPTMAMRMLEHIARHGVLPAAETERRLEAVRPSFATWCTEPRPLWLSIKNVLSLPHASLALRTLAGAGLMTAIFPEWARVEDMPAADATHRYTPEEETLIAVEHLVELRSAAGPVARRFAELAAEIDNPAPVAFALLFHGAGLRAEEARAAMARIEMPREERADVEFLIANQREFGSVIGGRDLDDPATARLLAGRVGAVERLRMLAVMTYAGLAANPDEMSPWRMEQFWHAYDATRQELTRELETDRIQEVPSGMAGYADFVRGFPARYLRAHPAAEIEAHLRLFDLSRPTGVAVQLDPLEGVYRVVVVARDRPYLFASLAGAISSFGLDILKAEAFANSKGVILDTFVFADPKRALQLNPSEIERLTDLIRRVALGKTDAQRLMRNRPRPEPRKNAPGPRVRFDSEACDTATLVEIVAVDRPGLLYSLAMVFSSNNCNIDVVLIDTQHQQAIDVFYVAYEGRKLTPDLQARLEEKLVAAC